MHDYFAGDQRARLLSPEGASLAADVIAALAGPLAPGQYAQATPAPAAAEAVGRVATVQGNVTIVRNGVAITANTGDAILKGDVLQTATGQLGVTFNDGSTLNLTANARLVVNEFVYDPNGTTNSQILNLVQGSLTFISGEVAHTGDMRIGTPVATMGIRGTVGGVTNANDGTVNFYVSQSDTGAVIYDRNGTVIAQVTATGPLIVVTPVGPLDVLAQELQKTPQQLATELAALQQIVNIQSVGQQILQQLNQPNPNPNPNPQSTDHPTTGLQLTLPPQNTEPTNPTGGDTNPNPEPPIVLITTTNPVTGTTVTQEVIIPPANLTPINFGPLTQTMNEDGTLVFNAGNANRITVFDSDTATLTVTLTASHGVLTLSGIAGLVFAGGGNGTAAMTFSGTQAAINAALNGMTFKPDPDYNGPASIQVSSSDGNSTTAPTTFAITVLPVNDAPETTTPATASGNIDAASIAVSLAGTDIDGTVAKFRITTMAANGTLYADAALSAVIVLNGTVAATSNAATVYFVPDANWSGATSLQFAAIDNQNGEDATPATAAINVAAPNDAPQFDFADYSFSAQENLPYGAIVGTVKASDANNDALIYSILSGNDDHVFMIDSAGNIIVTGLLDYESFTSRDLAIAATDPGGLFSEASVHVTIQDVSEPSSVTLSSTGGVQISAAAGGATSGFTFAGAGNVTTPGTPEDRIVLGYDLGASHVVLSAAPLMSEQGLTPLGTSSYSADGVSYFASLLSAQNGVTLTQTIGLGADANYFTTTIDVFNGSGSDISNVRFMRTLDPDQDVPSETFDTYNDVVQNPTGSLSVAAVKATGPVTGTVVELVGDGANWRASAFGFTNTDPYVAAAYDSPQDPNGASADIAIALTNNIGTISAGGSAHISYITTANVATTGANALVGDANANSIDGLGGKDILFGLGGADTFVFKAGYGANTVADFSGHALGGQGDLIELYDFGFANFAELLDGHILDIDRGGGIHDTMIDHGGGDTVTLLKVNSTTLVADDFSFHIIVA